MPAIPFVKASACGNDFVLIDGMHMPPDLIGFAKKICDRHNVLLIFDEIITGAGRTGHLFAAETFGVLPDILCTAKGLAGGFAPLSAMICRQPLADAFWGPIEENPGFVEGHTFEGNPMSCSVDPIAVTASPSATPDARLNEMVTDGNCA